jgi:hypothetical protein
MPNRPQLLLPTKRWPPFLENVTLVFSYSIVMHIFQRISSLKHKRAMQTLKEKTPFSPEMGGCHPAERMRLEGGQGTVSWS